MPPNTSLDPRQSRRYTHNRSVLETQRSGGNDSTEGGSEAIPQSFPARHSSRGAVASHFQAYGGETWIDFLRESGTDQTVHRQPPSNNSNNNPATTSDQRPQPSTSRQTLPNRTLPRTDSSSSRSSDRKRRLTTAESPMRRPSSIRMHSSNAGNTSSDPIVLDASPAPSRALPQPPLPSVPPQANTESVRRQSDLVLPSWQPDAEVSQCPVCGRYFTFLFRKHHCRKCGRVVCSSCSPHRITIPRQFIVHPPADNTSSVIDLTCDDDGTTMSSFGPFRNPALGGGEEVRVCNPCVPDPNFNPPPQYNPPASSRYPATFSASSSSSYVPPFPPPQPRQHRSSSNAHDASQTIGHGQTQRPRDLFSSNSENRRVNYPGGSNAGERRLPPLPNSSAIQASRGYGADDSIPRSLASSIPNNAPLPPIPNSASVTRTSMFPRSLYTPIPAPPLLPQQPQPQPSRPRRQIAEEDECPICGDELPQKGHGNDESARTQHIEECIALHSASPAPAATLTRVASASLPSQRTRGMSSAGGNGEGASNQNRMSHAARGMFPYIATEKDCMDDEGREAECIICLEDFEAGDRMARLVCWCKFHEKCIKEWWVKKGRGACPTHQLQE
ncbi:FYVE-domain-containing protein [Cucurbitaria berberidis CBS 394.84]|uniref:RING-type E3 ubiquitin transferase n=1 Tax=Cucurbitaria berberidis CBS 394.84 TaxID=1168544 RepID=A0A9P4GHM9_9PLEO|nr:FYVE-domain-containing protein [Cucurbitaria berberidis CBS 394.84]KAF1846328.1 FYVE-domain-containing protein [Cucurbitaria berberidis CBS 394.84]